MVAWSPVMTSNTDTGPNHIDRRADQRPQQSFADSHCASQV